MSDHIIVLGAGAWGTAVANLLANNINKEIILWAFENEVVNDINEKNINSIFLSKIKLNKNIKAVSNFKGIVSRYVFVVVPSKFVYSVVKKYMDNLRRVDKNNMSIVICSKGFDPKKKLILSDVIKPLISIKKIAILSGPSFAKLVAENKPAAITLASKNVKLLREVRNLLANKNFRVYTSNDIIGVQINGTVKNILAIAAGIAEGLDYGENARAALITRGILEIKKI